MAVTRSDPGAQSSDGSKKVSVDAFLSYSREDKKYFPLLVRMLEFHRIAVWYDLAGIRAGTKYKEDLETALATAECLLVLVTKNSVASRWVAREIASFRGSKPDAPLLPLLFEDVAVEDLFEGLSDFHAIEFFEDIDQGFSKLMGAFGKSYLPVVERREEADRRSAERRQEDRRRLSIEARLRIGMWKNYFSATGLGEYDRFGEVDKSTRDPENLPNAESDIESGVGVEPDNRLAAVNRLARIFARGDSELRRYKFVDRTSEQEVQLDFELLRALAHATCREMEMFGQLKNIYVIERFAEKIGREFRVMLKDRREGDRRYLADRRSETDSNPAGEKPV